MEALFWNIGTGFMLLGVVFMFFGALGLFRFRNFYPRLLVMSKIDTVGSITLILGIALRHGLSPMTFKVLALGVIILTFNPLIAHLMARAAYVSNHSLHDETSQGDD